MTASLVGGKRFGSGIFFLFVNDLYLKLKEIIFGTILILAMLKRTCHRILCHIGIEAIKKCLFRMAMYWIYLSLLILLQFFIEYNLQTYSFSTDSVFCSSSVDLPNVPVALRNLAFDWRIEKHFFLSMPMKQLVVSHPEIACKPGSASVISNGKSWVDMSIIFKFGPVPISRSKSASIFCW